MKSSVAFVTALRRFTAFPWKILVFTVLIMIGFGMLGRPTAPGVISGAAQIIRKTGDPPLTLVAVQRKLFVQDGALSGASVEVEQSAAGTMRRLVLSDGKRGAFLSSDGSAELRLGMTEGQPEYVVKIEDEGFALIDVHGTRIYRVKVKGAKVNIYGAQDERILRVKDKDGSWLIRTEADVDTGRISVQRPFDGDDLLLLLGALVVPIDSRYRVLLFSHFAQLERGP